MKARQEYKYELRVFQEAPQPQSPELEEIREMVTRGVKRLGLTLTQPFQPDTFAPTLHDEQSVLIEAIVLIFEERMNENRRRQNRLPPSA